MDTGSARNFAIIRNMCECAQNRMSWCFDTAACRAVPWVTCACCAFKFASNPLFQNLAEDANRIVGCARHSAKHMSSSHSVCVCVCARACNHRDIYACPHMHTDTIRNQGEVCARPDMSGRTQLDGVLICPK